MRIGEYQDLVMERETQHGWYLADDEAEVLLPRGQVPRGAVEGDTLNVFVYTDSEDRPIATMHKPKGVVGDFVTLKVVDVTNGGAFLDWSLDKDLFCPLGEQQYSMRVGEMYVVRIFLDEFSQRVVCTARLSRFLETEAKGLKQGQPIKILVADFTPDWISVIIDGKTKGAIFPDEWHERLEIGDERDAFVKRVRPDDGRVAVSLRPQGFQAVLGESDRILQMLRDAGGVLPVSDRSSPEDIHRRFGLSKGAFKKLIGTLYREGLIEIEAKSIRLK
jgi:uncharacterized protein